MVGVNDKQIAGTHYKSNYQLWDFVEDNNIGYLEASVVKYVLRHKVKNGLEDVEKAKHYIEKLKELALNGRLPKNIGVDSALLQDSLRRFLKENKLGAVEKAICTILLNPWKMEDLDVALLLISGLEFEYT